MLEPDEQLRTLNDEDHWTTVIDRRSAAILANLDTARATTPRRWVAAGAAVAVAAAAAVAVIVGTAGNGSDHASALRHPGSVPWRALPAKFSPRLVGDAGSSIPACTAGQLSATSPGAGTVAGEFHELIVITNVSQAPCAVQGAPTGLQSHAQGLNKNLTTSARGGAGQRIGLLPNDSVTTSLETDATCQGKPLGPAPAGQSLTMKLAGLDLTVPSAHLPAEAYGCQITVSPVAPQASGKDPGDFPSLTATVSAPASVQAGDTLSYEVTLNNSGASDVSFGGNCPTYIELLGPTPAASEQYSLNCSGTSVPAGGSTAYQMQMTIPHGATGTLKLAWIMSNVVSGTTLAIT